MAETRIEIRLRPRGRADELLGFEGDVLQARVTAPRSTAGRTAPSAG